ncbi:hypothetical protein OFEAOIEE_LOCUS245 [Methylorubrum extorquens]
MIHGRAIIGVIAFYALVLQTFLGGLAPLPALPLCRPCSSAA